MTISRLDFFAGCALIGEVVGKRGNSEDANVDWIEYKAKELDEKLPIHRPLGDAEFVFESLKADLKELRAAMREINDRAGCYGLDPVDRLFKIKEIAARFVDE